MHTISVVESNGFYAWACSCGKGASGYATESAAWGVGFAHKQVAGNSLNQQPGGSDDPYMGY